MMATNAWAAQRELTPDGNGGYYINMPTTGTDTLVIPDGVTTFNVYDDGGAEGNYSINCNGNLLLTAPEGKVLRLTGRVEATSYAYLYAYNGSDDDARKFFGYPGEYDVPRKLSSNRNLFLNFFSIGGDAANGLFLTITVVDVNGLRSVVLNESENGTIAASPIEAAAGEEISLTITPNEGYYLNVVAVRDEYDNIVRTIGGEWYSNNASFVMPNTDALVTPYFYSVSGYSLEMDMPTTGTRSAIVPNGVTSFTIKKTSAINNGLIVLTAPEGKVFQLSNYGQNEENDDSLFVYDGNDINSTSLWASTTYEIVPLTSSNRYMTLKFKGDGINSNKRGYFVVKVIDANEEHDIVVVNSDGGIVSTSVGSARVNDIVTLTASPADGYMLDYITVVDDGGVQVNVTGGTWYESGPISFKMPSSAVSVRPVFVPVDGIRSVNMPRFGEMTFAIPEGVDSIKVYDDGGKDGVFSAHCNGFLLLTAPEGKLLRIEGSIRVGNYLPYGELKIYEKFDDNRNDNLLLYVDYDRNGLKAISTGRYVLFNFKTNGGGLDGLDLTVTVVDPAGPNEVVINPPEWGEAHGTVSSNYTEAMTGAIVTLTIDSDSGYRPGSVSVKDEYGNDIEVTGSWYTTGNTYSFTMPSTKAFVYPSYKNAEDPEGLYIPETGMLSVNIPNYIKKLYVGDDRNEYNDGTLVLTAPEGSVIELVGGVYGFENVDSLYIYDGADFNAPLLLKTSVAPVDYIYSTGRSLTIRYKRTGPAEEHIRRDVDLDVRIVDPSAEHEIYISEYIEGGEVESSHSKAKYNTVVSLTAEPAEGYYLSNIEVRNDDYVRSVVTGGTWYTSNEASFTMPASDVDVYASFASELSAEGGLFVYTPILEPLRIVVPDSVRSFKVRGASSSVGIISQPLILTASEGQILTLGGNLSACNERVEDIERPYTNFYMCDGDISNPSNESTSGKTISILYGETGEGYNDVTVYVVDPTNDPRSISIETTGCGHFETDLDLDAVLAGTPVKFVAVPDEGCFVEDTYAMGSMWDSEFPINVTGGTWYSGDTVQFTMPYADVYINVVFSESSIHYVRVPAFDTLKVDIPEGISEFAIYDDGGPEGRYSNSANGYLVLTIPEGKVLSLIESYLDLESGYDSLYVYEGNNNVTEAFLSGGYVSAGPSLTFYLKSDGGVQKDGFELIMSIVEKEEHQIILGESEYGIATVDPATGIALTGDAVTINATPNEGYVFAGINVYDIDENFLFEVKENAWYSNSVKFTMPIKDIYVEPVFVTTDDLNYELNIPKTGNIAVNIPEGVIQLMVYDDNSGYYGAYSNNNDGSLTLTAPEGYSLCVYGEIATPEEADSLVIYDGDDVNATKLLKKYGQDEIDGVFSSGRSLTLRFKSNAEWNSYGLNLYVTVMKKSGSAAVAVYEVYGSKFARIDGLYNGKDTVNIEEDIEVSYVEFVRDFAVTANDSGKYSTIVFPFDFNASSVSGLDDILEFSQMTEENGKLQVEMNRVWCRADVDPDRDCSSYEGNIKANTPYMLKMTDQTLVFNGSDYTIKKTEPAVATSGNWQFIGTYAYKKWEKGDTDLGSVYGFAATASNGVEVGQFVKAGSGAYIRPMRAYLKYSTSNGEPRPAPAGHVSVWRDRSNELPEEIEVVVVEGKGRASIESGESGSEKKTTVIGRINTRTGEFTPVTRTYDLKGRSLNAKPKAKGVYVEKKR